MQALKVTVELRIRMSTPCFHRLLAELVLHMELALTI